MDQGAEKVNRGTITDTGGKTFLYTWGLGKSGQLGTGYEHTEHTPKMVKLMADKKKGDVHLKQVACGGLYTAVVTEEGDVFAFGCGKYGRLATGAEDNTCTAVKVSIPEKVTKASCGSWHGAAVSFSGHLVVWGHKKACGQTSSEFSGDRRLSAGTVLTPPSVLNLSTKHKLVGVACGHNYTIAWMDVGRVLSWGSGHHGVLGHGSVDDVPLPKLISALQEFEIVEAAAGYSHSAFISSDGCVYTCGKGKDGALGLGEKHVFDVTSPTCVSFPEGVRVVKVSCSVGEHHGHTLALTNNGHVFAWGDGYKGKLGLGDQETQYIPTLIPPENFNMESVVVVCAGGIHSTAATAAGNVFTWGCGSDGRLGHPEGQGHRYLFRSDKPKRVEGLGDGVKQALVACSYYHTAAIVQL